MRKVIIILSFVLISCGSNQSIIPDNSKEKLSLPFKFETIEIIDERGTLLPMNWDVPLIAGRKREWKGNPELSEKHKSEIIRIIKNSEKKDGIPINSKFIIKRGDCELKGNWKSVTEYTKFEAELHIEIPSENYFYKSYGEIFYNKPTLNGKEKNVIKMYELAMKNVTHMVLKKLNEEYSSK